VARKLVATKVDQANPEWAEWMYASETIGVKEEPLERDTPIMALRRGCSWRRR